MTVDYIRYDILTQDALRSVVQTVLADAAAKGLPGEHHFLISFDTRAEGVGLSPRLKAQYPKEMTIVLQHQFWDMVVTDDRFEVGLSFSGIPERLVVPFRAIRGFADPSVQFGLQFAATTDEDEGDDAGVGETARPPAHHEHLALASEELVAPADPEAAAPARPATKPAVKSAAKPAAKPAAVKQAAKPVAVSEKTPDDQPATPTAGGEVVRLDRFRKK